MYKEIGRGFPIGDGRPIIGDLTSGTVVASTSGTEVSFTGIPSWAKRITIIFSGVSQSGADDIVLELGDSGGYETSGYLGTRTTLTNAAAVAVLNTTGNFRLTTGTGTADTWSGIATLALIDAATFTWVLSSLIAKSNGVVSVNSGGDKSTSAALNSIRFSMTGVDTFDAGKINIFYE